MFVLICFSDVNLESFKKQKYETEISIMLQFNSYASSFFYRYITGRLNKILFQEIKQL